MMITLRDAWLASKRIKKITQQTPLIFSEPLSEIAGKHIYLKLENRNVTGSFKIRGAANKLLQLSDEAKGCGVVTFSTGNFGRSLAYVAKKLGIKSFICISHNVPDAKVLALERTGAKIIKVGKSQDDAEAFCYQLKDEQGLTVVSPFDDEAVISGHATIGLEILHDLPAVDTVVAGLSGGGLHAGLGTTLKQTEETIRLVGISVDGSAAMYDSILQGYPVTVTEKHTLADSLLGGIGHNNQYTLELVRKYVDSIILIKEEPVAAGMAFMLQHHQMVIEGAGAVGIGAVLQHQVKLGEENVIVVTGSSVNPEVLWQVMKNHFQVDGG